MSGTTMVILSAFVAYLLLMIVIGVVYMKKTSSSEDYFLGGRGLNAWVAALSAQASDMSGWLLMGLPGAIYSLGTGQIWIAVGLFIGTVLNWVCISHRLRKYTIAANNSLTIPAFLENRFQDKKRILLLLSSIVIVIFFLVYTASALAAGGKLFNTVFGIDYHIALAIGAAVILCYTFMGGFMAVCVTDFVQGTLMLIGLLIVPLVAYLTLSGSLSDLLTQSGAPGGAAAFLNPFENGERPYTFVEIFSQLAWGLGYCGKEVVNLFKNHPRGTYDLILMDIMMPNMDGHQAAKAIRALGIERSDAVTIPIIALSANAFIDDIQESLNSGMNDHISKPINMEELIDTITKYIKHN